MPAVWSLCQVACHLRDSPAFKMSSFKNVRSHGNGLPLSWRSPPAASDIWMLIARVFMSRRKIRPPWRQPSRIMSPTSTIAFKQKLGRSAASREIQAKHMITTEGGRHG